MGESSNVLKKLKEQALLFDGAVGTLLNARGVPLGYCKDELNLTNPDLVRSIHRDYLRAGADVIETNTWGANLVKLSAFELEEEVREINLRGVELARKEAGTKAFVAGSVGSLGTLIEPYGRLKLADVQKIYREQIEALVEGGVDLLCIETMSSAVEAEEAVKVAKSAASVPVMALMTFTFEGVTKLGDEVSPTLHRLVKAGADVVGINCTLGPKETYDILNKEAASLPDVPLAVMPNAGYPQVIGSRIIYLTSPDYFREYAALFLESGVSVVGGCCGTTPDHTAAMAPVVKEARPAKSARPAKAGAEEGRILSFPALMKEEAPKPSKFLEKLGKEFVQTVEITPPKGPDCSAMIKAARMLRAVGIDAVNITDNPLARVRMSSIMLAYLLQREAGAEPIIHYTCRDKNVLGIQADLIGAAALGLRCILSITGDPLKIGDYPDAKAVFEVDSTGLVKIIDSLNRGKDLAGNDIGSSTSFKIAVGINPLAEDWDFERKKIRDKIEGGAHFALTQPIYEVPEVEKFVKRMEEFPELPVLIGLLPIRSYRNAKFLYEEVPYITIPKAILKRMEAVKDKSREAQVEESVTIAAELYRGMREAGAQGLYFMPQLEKYDMVVEIVRRAEAL
jgi:homocysteine S-methyltransferase